MNIVIIKYNAGNVLSVTHALQRLGVQPILSDEPEVIQAADKVIFPGVGEASTTMRYLREGGLDKLIPSLKQKVLGICLGMQLMCAYSEEGDTDCLGIFPEQVKLFPSGERKVPHMGWNQLEELQTPLMQKLPEESYVYFVHSYYVEKGPDTIASVDYGVRFSAALQRDNFYATQFHPEKSSKVGAQILDNFLQL
ncbi:MAG: imidazole glycerol phosphate synthase subunit HisH [Bacteroidota bacterium]